MADSNRRRKTYAMKSNAVSVPIEARITVTSLTQSGKTITVNGTGFSTLTVINFFNAQSSGVVNLGGFKPGGLAALAILSTGAADLDSHRDDGMERLPGRMLPVLQRATLLMPSGHENADTKQPLTLTIVLKRNDQTVSRTRTRCVARPITAAAD